jgi:hypothetical protein
MKWFLLVIVMQGSVESMTVNQNSFISLNACNMWKDAMSEVIEHDLTVMYPGRTETTIKCVDEAELQKVTIDQFERFNNNYI